MTRLTHEIDIIAPIETVWKVLENLEAISSYHPIVESAEYISEERTDVGSARHCTFDDGNSVDECVIESTPLRSLTLEMTNFTMPIKIMRWTGKLEQADNSVRLTSIAEYTPKYGILGAMMNAMMIRKKFDGVLGNMVRNLKTHVEDETKETQMAA